MIEVVRDPGLQETEAAEIHNETALVEFLAAKLDLDAPVMAVQKRAMAVVPVLPVGERDIAVGLAAGKHGTASR
jgi:hypothetical protein